MALLAAAMLLAAPASAQQTARDRANALPEDLPQPGTASRPARNIGTSPPVESDGELPDLFGDAMAGDPAADPESGDDAAADRPRTRKPVVDGDLSYPAEPVQPQDGTSGPEASDTALDDSGDDAEADTRPQEEIDMFESPPAGFDPLLFQIEDIDPVLTDRRPARLFRLEPYDPIGIKIGSFVLFPVVEVAGLATNNVLSSPTARSDQAAEVATRTRFVSNWSVHALELNATTYNTFYDEFSSENDEFWAAEARGRIDISRRTNLQGLLSHDIQQESRSAIDASAIGLRPDVTTDIAALTLNHRFNKLSLQLRGALTDVAYSDTPDAINTDRNTKTVDEAVRATWEFKPTLSVFTEGGLNQRAYETVALSDGIGRDSQGERYRVGLDFGSTSRILRGEASIGYGRQTPNDGRLSDVEGFLFDSNLAWRPTELTSFLLLARTDLYDTNTVGSAGVVTRQIGIEARHAFRRYFIATAGLAYTKNDYDAVPVEDEEWRTTLLGEYYVSPEIILFGRYLHTAFRSPAPDSDYDADDFRLGVRLRR